jgi:hypothetical protein
MFTDIINGIISFDETKTEWFNLAVAFLSRGPVGDAAFPGRDSSSEDLQTFLEKVKDQVGISSSTITQFIQALTSNFKTGRHPNAILNPTETIEDEDIDKKVSILSLSLSVLTVMQPSDINPVHGEFVSLLTIKNDFQTFTAYDSTIAPAVPRWQFTSYANIDGYESITLSAVSTAPAGAIIAQFTTGTDALELPEGHYLVNMTSCYDSAVIPRSDTIAVPAPIVATNVPGAQVLEDSHTMGNIVVVLQKGGIAANGYILKDGVQDIVLAAGDIIIFSQYANGVGANPEVVFKVTLTALRKSGMLYRDGTWMNAARAKTSHGGTPIRNTPEENTQAILPPRVVEFDRTVHPDIALHLPYGARTMLFTQLNGLYNASQNGRRDRIGILNGPNGSPFVVGQFDTYVPTLSSILWHFSPSPIYDQVTRRVLSTYILFAALVRIRKAAGII